MIDTSIIGTKTDWVKVEIEKGAIRKFADAIGSKNPLYFDEDYAREKGFRSLVCPTTFPATFHLPKPGIELELTRTLHGGQEYEYERPLVAGDVLQCQSELMDVFQRQGKELMTFYIIETSGKDETGQIVYKSRATIIQR